MRAVGPLVSLLDNREDLGTYYGSIMRLSHDLKYGEPSLITVGDAARLALKENGTPRCDRRPQGMGTYLFYQTERQRDPTCDQPAARVTYRTSVSPANSILPIGVGHDRTTASSSFVGRTRA